ncbi:MAG: GNAT family N-acetyltransferase [Thermoplasmatota archaeon]
MDIEILSIEKDELHKYARVPIKFEVKSILEVELVDDGIRGIKLKEKKLSKPYERDYDDVGEEAVKEWPNEFDVENWAFYLVEKNNNPIGGATVAFDSLEVNMLGGKKDITVLWDIRVHPDLRGLGIGSSLFKKAVEYSREKGCKYMKVETQNINVPACKFYRKMGCRLGEIDRFAYHGDEEVKNDTMLIWYLKL